MLINKTYSVESNQVEKSDIDVELLQHRPLASIGSGVRELTKQPYSPMAMSTVTRSTTTGAIRIAFSRNKNMNGCNVAV